MDLFSKLQKTPGNMFLIPLADILKLKKRGKKGKETGRYTEVCGQLASCCDRSSVAQFPPSDRREFVHLVLNPGRWRSPAQTCMLTCFTAPRRAALTSSP